MYDISVKGMAFLTTLISPVSEKREAKTDSEPNNTMSFVYLFIGDWNASVQ
jgi:hypothetical protein